MDLQFNVAQLLKEPIGGARQYEIDTTYESEGFVVRSPLIGRVKLLNTGRSILVKGVFQLTVELVCSRCLTPFLQHLDFSVEEEFLPTIPVGGMAPVVKEEEDVDEDLFIDAHQILHLEETVRQYILLNIPVHPLCRPDCKGLCPICGQNLNEGTCNCREEEVDPRWAVLMDLSKKE